MYHGLVNKEALNTQMDLLNTIYMELRDHKVPGLTEDEEKMRMSALSDIIEFLGNIENGRLGLVFLECASENGPFGRNYVGRIWGMYNG